MALEEVTNNSDTLIASIITDIGQLGQWIQAIGLVIILWIIFEIIILINNRIKRKRLYAIEEKLESIEDKIDKILKNKK